MKTGRLLLRTVVGGLFVGHGTQKLFGWFEGYGLDATANMFGSLGLRPAKAHALTAAVSETGGGAAVLLGAQTPLAASVLIGTMVTAIRKVHGSKGPWATNGGYEYNLVLIAALAALAETGPGSPSIDAARGRERHGPKWALLALALGIAGGLGAEAVSSLFPEDAPADATDAPGDAGDTAAADTPDTTSEPAPAPTDAAEAAPTADNGSSAS
jgi:putative oxidoreductase